jgi:hypothetical protein
MDSSVEEGRYRYQYTDKLTDTDRRQGKTVNILLFSYKKVTWPKMDLKKVGNDEVIRLAQGRVFCELETFGFYKGPEMSSPSERLLVSHERLFHVLGLF